MRPVAHIISYFSRETDLAGTFGDWPEFKNGQGYSVDLASTDGAQTVCVRFLDDGGEEGHPCVCVEGNIESTLFERVIEATVEALAADSDYVEVERRE